MSATRDRLAAVLGCALGLVASCDPSDGAYEGRGLRPGGVVLFDAARHQSNPLCLAGSAP